MICGITLEVYGKKENVSRYQGSNRECRNVSLKPEPLVIDKAKMEKARRIIYDMRERRQRNSTRPEVWQFNYKQEEAERLKRQLENLARELGIEL